MYLVTVRDCSYCPVLPASSSEGSNPPKEHGKVEVNQRSLADLFFSHWIIGYFEDVPAYTSDDPIPRYIPNGIFISGAHSGILSGGLNLLVSGTNLLHLSKNFSSWLLDLKSLAGTLGSRRDGG